ncbi:MAG: hypothetical protein ABII03_04850 [Nanoarchaeota archaeon]
MNENLNLENETREGVCSIINNCSARSNLLVRRIITEKEAEAIYIFCKSKEGCPYKYATRVKWLR